MTDCKRRSSTPQTRDAEECNDGNQLDEADAEHQPSSVMIAPIPEALVAEVLGVRKP